MIDAVAGRVRFRDVKPCHAPTTLDALRGPYHGLIDLPHGVRWQEDRVGIDVDDAGGGAWPTRRCSPKGGWPNRNVCSTGIVSSSCGP